LTFFPSGPCPPPFKLASIFTCLSTYAFAGVRRTDSPITSSATSSIFLNRRQHPPSALKLSFFPVFAHACSNHTRKALSRCTFIRYTTMSFFWLDTPIIMSGLLGSVWCPLGHSPPARLGTAYPITPHTMHSSYSVSRFLRITRRTCSTPARRSSGSEAR